MKGGKEQRVERQEDLPKARGISWCGEEDVGKEDDAEPASPGPSSHRCGTEAPRENLPKATELVVRKSRVGVGFVCPLHLQALRHLQHMNASGN